MNPRHSSLSIPLCCSISSDSNLFVLHPSDIHISRPGGELPACLLAPLVFYTYTQASGVGALPPFACPAAFFLSFSIFSHRPSDFFSSCFCFAADCCRLERLRFCFRFCFRFSLSLSFYSLRPAYTATTLEGFYLTPSLTLTLSLSHSLNVSFSPHFLYSCGKMKSQSPILLLLAACVGLVRSQTFPNEATLPGCGVSNAAATICRILYGIVC